MSIESQKHQKKDVQTPSKTEAARVVFPDTKDREGFSNGQKIAGTVLALGILAGGVATANYLSSHPETITTAPADENEGIDSVTTTQPTTEPSPFASPSNIIPLETASQTASPEVTANPSQSLEIKTGQSPEALGKNLFEVALPNWHMAGADDKIFDKVLNYVMKNGYSQLEGYYRELAKENTAAFSSALLSDTLRPEVAKGFEHVNMWVMDTRMRTNDDAEPYKVWNTVESSTLVSTSGTTRTVLVTLTSHDNSKTGVNTAEKYIPAGLEIDGDKFEAQVTFDSASGSEKITSYTVLTIK